MKIGINNARRIAAVAAIAIALSTVSAFGRAIRGTVKDTSGAAVSGAIIRATNSATKLQSATRSGDKGFFNLLELPTGDYDITVDADGFEPRVLRNIRLGVDVYDLNIEMKPLPRGSIRGTVSDPSGAAVSGVIITATNNATYAKTQAASSDKGFYNFPRLLTGDYNILAEAVGFTTVLYRNVSVTEGVYDLNIEMKPGSTPEIIAIPAARDYQALPEQGNGRAVNLTPEGIFPALRILKDDMDDLIRYYSSSVWWYEDKAGEAAPAKLKECPCGALRGTIKDASGAAVSGAIVIASNMSANGKLRAITVSNDKGVYNFPELPAGDYLVTAERSDFDPYLLRDVRVDTGVYDLNIEMEPIFTMLGGNWLLEYSRLERESGNAAWRYAEDPAYDPIANRIFAATLGKSAIASAKKCPCGAIRGTVKDASGAAVPDALIVAVNLAADRKVRAERYGSDFGIYFFNELQTGYYDIIIEADGFEPQLLRNISVGGDVYNLNIVIKPEAKAETSAAPAPPTSLALTLPGASSGTAIPENIRKLPILNGDMDDLIRYYSSSVWWYEDEAGEADINTGFNAGEAAAARLKECPCGAIRGTIKDPSGAAVPSAIVIAVNMSANGKLRAITVSNDKGVYNFPELPAGDYLITAEYTAFDPYLQRDVRVGTGVYDLNIEMKHIALPIGNLKGIIRALYDNGAVSWRYADDPAYDPIANRILAATLGKSAIARAKKCPCGAIRGTVIFPPGAAVFGAAVFETAYFGATVTATNITAGGRVSAIMSIDETGFYNFPELQTGDYEIKVASAIVEPALFEPQILRNISVGVDVYNNLNIVIKPE